MAPPLPRLDGKYEILQRMREGGMGALYHVRHRLLGDERVVKVIRPQLEHHPTLRERFLREARAASRLRHPNVAQLYDFTLDDEGFAYIVMEYVQGLTFEELLAVEGPPPLPLVTEIAAQSLRALGHLHRHGMVHRDIAPDNLMLTRDVDGRPLVKLIDLGLAKMVDGGRDLTDVGMFVGKLRYAAPEQLGEEDRQATPRSDLYAFALVLYELLTGHHPIVGDSATSVITSHLMRPPLPFEQSDPAGRVPSHVRQAVLRTLAKAPAERFASAEELATALQPPGTPTPALDGDDAVRHILELTRWVRPSGGETTGSTTQRRLDQRFSESGESRALADPAATARIATLAEPAATVAEAAASPAHEPSTVRLARPAPGSPQSASPEPPPPRVPEATAATASVSAAEVEGDGEPAAAPVLDPAPAVAAVEELLEAGQFDAAREAIARARQAYPEAAELDELAARLEEMERLSRGPRVRRLVFASQDAAERGDHPAALAALREAVHLLPGDPHLRELVRDTERAARRQATEEQRQAAIAERAATIAELLDRERLAEARDALREAGERFGAHESFGDLRRRLEDAEAALHARRIEEALGAARRALDAGRPEEAADPLATVEDLDPENGDLAVLRERQRAVLASDRERLAEASRREAERRAGRADALVAEARSLSQTEDFTEAQKTIRRAIELAPDHPEARTLEQRVSALREVQRREAEESTVYTAAVEEIRQLLAGGAPGDAMKTLQRAIGRFGEREELQTLRMQAAQAFLTRDREERIFHASPAPAAGPAPPAAMGSLPTRAVDSVAGPGASAPPPPPRRTAPPAPPAVPVAPRPPERDLRSPVDRTLRLRTDALLPREGPARGPARPMTSGIDDLLIGPGTLEEAAPADASPAGPPPRRPALEGLTHLQPSDPRFWVVIGIVMIVFALAGAGLAYLGRDAAPASGAPAELEVEDVEEVAPGIR